MGRRKVFDYFGVVTQVTAPDNPKSLIANSDLYGPQVGCSCTEFAAHYGSAVIPVQPRKPQDKDRVEVGMQVIGRWILARLHRQQFFSLTDLNLAFAGLLEDLSARPFKKLHGSRRGTFEAIDKPALKFLSTTFIELSSWKKAWVGIGHHVELEHHHCSVPYQYARKAVELRYAAGMVEVQCDANALPPTKGWSHRL